MSAPAAMVDAARNRLGQAQAAYAAALEQGAGTREARSRLERAQDDLAAMQAQARAEVEQAEAQRRRQVAEAATAEAKAAAQQVASRLREMVAVPLPSIELPAGIVAAVFEARARAAQAADAAGSAQARVAHLQARQQEMEQRRAAITAKRQAGQGDDSRDGAELALIAADSEGLSELLAQAVTDAAEPTRRAEEAAHAIASAEQLWAQAVAQAEAQALVQVCASLESALVEAATRLYPHRLSGAVQAWRASTGLRHLLDFGSPMMRGAA